MIEATLIARREVGIRADCADALAVRTEVLLEDGTERDAADRVCRTVGCVCRNGSRGKHSESAAQPHG